MRKSLSLSFFENMNISTTFHRNWHGGTRHCNLSAYVAKGCFFFQEYPVTSSDRDGSDHERADQNEEEEEEDEARTHTDVRFF